MNRCRNCGRELTVYDVGYYKKMVNRGAESDLLCIVCTASYFRISEEKAWEMIERFRAMGCTLFPPLPDAPQRMDR